jgi:tetratricopeptide (TPR) repeat protein
LKTSIYLCCVVFFLCTPHLSAQNTSVGGQISRSDGSPWGALSLSILNTETGELHTVRTDKDGRYALWGLRPGIYKITLSDPNDKTFSYSETHTLHGADQTDVSVNFSKLNLGGDARQKNEEQDAAKFNLVKGEFNSGLGAMLDAESLRKDLSTAPDGNREEIKRRLNADYQTAIEKFQSAEATESPINTKTHAMILAHLGEAYYFAGRYDAAVDAYQKAAALQPDAVEYENLAKAHANFATNGSPRVEQELIAADESCSKAAALDPATGAKCWKNVAITLSNDGDMHHAEKRWLKITEITPNDSDAWFQLGRARLVLVETDPRLATSSEKANVIEAFRRCVAVDPEGPYAAQAKEALSNIEFEESGRPH